MTAQLIRHLIAHEVEPGGPYRNALDKPSAAPDLAANVSISRFIHYIGGPFPKLTSYIERQTAARPPTDRYASAWPQESMPTLRVTLQLVKQRPEANHPTPDRQLADQQFRDEYDTILSNAHQYITGLDQLVGESIAAMLRRIIKADANYEIGTLAVRFASSVISPRAVPKTTLQMLGGANLYNWVAYTIYDDFLDDEGTPQLLSTANIALRRAISLFNQAVPSDTFKQLVAEMFDIIDTANAWEVANCRFAVKHGSITIGALPDYTNLDRLYQRSLSHSLPALGVLLHAGAPAEAVTCVRSAFQEYLIIRQLSDDLHDWQDDLRMGRITYIVAQLLADAAITSGPKRLTSLIARLENTFWHHTLASISKQVNTHAMRARTLLAESGILESPNVIGQLAQGIEDNMARTLAEQHTANQFLVAYRVTTPVHPKIHSEAM